MKHRITYKAFSHKVGIAEAQLNRYANGAQLPNLRNAYKIFYATNKKVRLVDWFEGVQV